MMNPFANMAQLMQQFQQFRASFHGNPQETVQQMLNSGQITQEQLNQVMPLAQQFYGMMYGNKENGRG